MEVMAKVAFAVYTLIILSGCVVAVSSNSLVRALVGLITTLVGVAGMYLLLASPLMAFMQLLIYVGAVSVLIFFAVMLAKGGREGEPNKSAPMKKYVYTLAASIAPAAVLGWLVTVGKVHSIAVPTDIGIEPLGESLLGVYLLPFEIISAVLMIAMSGAVLLAWEKREEK